MLPLKFARYVVLFTITLLVSQLANARPLHLTTFNSQQGLSQNSINCSITDQQGFLWLATQGEFNSFDAYALKRSKANKHNKRISGN